MQEKSVEIAVGGFVLNSENKLLLIRGDKWDGAYVVPGGHVEFGETLEEALMGVDAIVLVTRWEEFSAVPGLLDKVNPRPIFVDGRRMLDKRLFARYEGIGL